MSIKSWVLDHMHASPEPSSRSRTGAGDPAFDGAREGRSLGAADAEPAFGAPRPEPSLADVGHLGAYAPLIAAIRDELEHFVASQVRLHLAIADRDRFRLTAIAVGCAEAPEPRRLLLQFMREFKPEQVKRYLVREVIAGLPNAAAIDLGQFAGLVDADVPDGREDDEYRDLIEALAPSAPPVLQPYRVEIVGRWSEVDGASAPVAARGGPATPPTPLAGPRAEFDIEDADGKRRVVLPAVASGRRYLVGKGEGCDVRVNGAFTSRRHAELWLENGSWFAADAGSTNGIRVEARSGVARRAESRPMNGAASGANGATSSANGATSSANGALAEAPLRLGEGERIVLSARAEGTPADYPSLSLRSEAGARALVTPIASALGTGVPKTPLTAVLPAVDDDAALRLTLQQAGGPRTLGLRAAALPAGIGRSRGQALVVDRRHGGVSGHHLAIVELDANGAQVVVHGDNGVVLDGVTHACGARFHWPAGTTLVLDPSNGDEPACTLRLDPIEPAGGRRS